GRGRLHGGPHRGDVRGADRRTRASRDADEAAGASLYTVVACRSTAARSRPATRLPAAWSQRRLRQECVGSAIPRRRRRGRARLDRSRRRTYRARAPFGRCEGTRMRLTRRTTLGLIASALVPGSLRASDLEPEYLRPL